MSRKKQTGKNITVYVPDHIAPKMDEFREVNWSQVCQAAIERYIEARKTVNPSVRLKLDQMKQEEEKAGYIFGSQLASDILDKLSYPEVHDFRWTWLDESLEPWWGDYPSLATDWLDDAVDGDKFVTNEARKKWRKSFEDAASKKGTIFWVLKLAEGKKGLRKNKAFFSGVINALRELLA